MHAEIFIAAIVAAYQVTSCACDVDTDWMHDALTGFFSDTRHHWTNPDYKVKAMRFIQDRFRGWGLETHIHPFSTQQPNVTGVNIIGMLRGPYFNTPYDKVVGIAAHYDTMRHTPGVDDNGAAVVTMLQAARELARQPHRNYTVLFIAFDFEEWEYSNNTMAACHEPSFLCGSMSFVSTWVPNFWTPPIGWRGIFVMDTIMNFETQQGVQHFPSGIGTLFPGQAADIKADGGRGDFLMVTGRMQDQALLDCFNSSWYQQGQPQFELELFPIPVNTPSSVVSQFARSDHSSFWTVGLNAVFITDTANFRGYMQQCYHHECDTLQHVTPDMINFAAKTCKTLISLVDTLSPPISASSRLQPSGFLVSAVVAVMTSFR